MRPLFVERCLMLKGERMKKLFCLFLIVISMIGCANFKEGYLKSWRAGAEERAKTPSFKEAYLNAYRAGKNESEKQSIKGISWESAKTSSVGNEGNFWKGLMGLGWNSLIFTGNVISSAIPEEQPVSNVVIGGRGPGYSCPAGYCSAPDGCHLCQGNNWPSINTNNHPVQR